MNKKLMQKLQNHQKYSAVALAGSKSPGARTGNSKGKASDGAATSTVPSDAGGKQHVPLPGTVNIPSPSHQFSSVHGEDTTRGSSGVGSDDPSSISRSNVDVDRRSRNKTMIPAASPSPGFKPVRKSHSISARSVASFSKSASPSLRFGATHDGIAAVAVFATTQERYCSKSH